MVSSFRPPKKQTTYTAATAMLAATTTALAGLGALSGASASFLNAIRAMPDVAGTWSGDNPLAVREVADELRWKPWDTVAKEWDGVLKHEDKEQCADVAIIIARGTFDDG